MPGGNSFLQIAHESFGCFKDFFQLTLSHGCAHMSDFDVLGGYVEFELFFCWQVENAVEVCLDSSVKTKQVDVVG